jgi:hypothetical protein
MAAGNTRSRRLLELSHMLLGGESGMINPEVDTFATLLRC